MAPILCAGVTTYKGIKETEARPGEWIAISGIGGLGHVAIQYTKAMGLHVVALDVTDEKLALARSLGAELAINARAPDAVAQVLKHTGGSAHGVLVIVAHGEMYVHFVAQSRHQGVNGPVALTLDRHVLTVNHDLGEDARGVVVRRDFARK